VHPYAPACKNCGYVYPVRQVLHGDGEIGEFRAAAVGLEEKQRWYSGLITIVSEIKPGSGWAYYLYKDKFGVFPSTALRKAPGPADLQMRGFVKSRQIAFAKRKQREGALR
jgi:DNA repair protein RadD